MAWTWDDLVGELEERGVDPDSVKPAAVEANRTWPTAKEAAQAIAWGYTRESYERDKEAEKEALVERNEELKKLCNEAAKMMTEILCQNALKSGFSLTDRSQMLIDRLREAGKEQ